MRNLAPQLARSTGIEAARSACLVGQAIKTLGAEDSVGLAVWPFRGALAT